MKRIIRVLAPFAILALLAACGDDDDASTAAEDVDDVLDESEDEAEDAAEDVIEGKLGDDCGFLGEFAGAGLDQAFAIDPATAMADGGANFAAAAEEFQEVADAAPDEIEDAFRTLAEGMEALATALSGADFSDPESFDPSAFEALENEDFEQAAQEVDAWVREHCGDVTG